MSVMTRTFLTGGDVVLANRVSSNLTIVIEGSRIVAIEPQRFVARTPDRVIDVSGHLIVPGFIDVHVHGVAGVDTLDGPSSVGAIAARLPQWGVTAFCPTSVACDPSTLETFLSDVGAARAQPPAGARVLPAHLESNFIAPEFCGAQPLACLRTPNASTPHPDGEFSAREILDVLDRARPDVGIVTLAPELPGGLDLVRRLSSSGVRVSLGHSGATYEEGQAAIAAGANHATHLFNRMRAMTHREPGLPGAILSSEDVAAEIICDGRHVHPAIVRMAIAAKGSDKVMAITDGTAGSGLRAGSRARLGGRPIVVADVARLEDGTMAGSVATMDRTFAMLVAHCGLDFVQAAALTSTTPARELGLDGLGVIAAGSTADLTILGAKLEVVATWVGGVQVWPPSHAGPSGTPGPR